MVLKFLNHCTVLSREKYFFLVVTFLFVSTKCWNQNLAVSHANGYHGEIFNLTIECEECTEIKFTLDGTDPRNGQPIIDKLEISPLLIPEKRLSSLPTTAIPNVDGDEQWHTWQKPDYYETAVAIKLGGYKNGELITDYEYRTYFFNLDWDLFPTMSLFINPSDFYDDSTGISVPGIHADPSNTIWTGNYHMKGGDWERRIHWTSISAGKTLQDEDVGVRIHGLKAGSAPQKSLRLYARKRYGSKSLKYKFEKRKKKKHQRLLLRTPYSGHSSKLISDVVAHELARPLDLEIMDYGFTRTFINGEYWGLHMVRERVDERYIAQHFKCKEDSVLIPGNYDQSEFQSIFDFIDNHNLSQNDAIDQFGELVDISNFTDYIICETFFGNTDWLENDNNVTFWKEKGKGKWRLILIDIDAGFQQSKRNMFEFIKEHQESMITKIFTALIKNDAYKKRLTQRYAEVLNTHFSPKRCFKIVDSIHAIVEPQIGLHIARWGHPTSVFAWNKDIDNLRSFINERPIAVPDQIEFSLHVDASDMRGISGVFFVSQDEKIIGFSILGLLSIFLISIRIRRRKKRKALNK